MIETEFFWDRMAERESETVSALKSGKVPKIFRFAMHLTSACNLRCQYCNEGHKPDVMNRDLFHNTALLAGVNGTLHVTGGEPMIVNWLEDEIQSLYGVTRFALNTNLTIRPKEKTCEALFRVKTSLDDYDAERWNKLVGGNVFNKVCDNIKYVSNLVKYTSVSYTATHRNAERVERFIDFCYKNFPSLYSLSISFYKGNSEMALTSKDIEVISRACEQLDANSRRVFFETHKLTGNYFPDNLTRPCYLSLTERLYDCYGTEYYCSHMFRDKVKAPGKPGEEQCCVTGCNARFNAFNKKIQDALGVAK